MLELLTQEMRDEGIKIIEALDQTEDKPTSAMWSFINNEWIFMLASMSTRVERPEDRNPAGARIGKIIKEVVPGRDIKFALTGPSSRYFRNLSMMIGTGPDDISGIQMSNNFVNGENTGENYVYRLSIQ